MGIFFFFCFRQKHLHRPTMFTLIGLVNQMLFFTLILLCFDKYPFLSLYTFKITACYCSHTRPFDWLKKLTNQHLPFAFVVVFAGPLLSPLGVASVYSHGALEWDDDKIPTSDGIGVIGKGRLQSVVLFQTLLFLTRVAKSF